MKMSAQRIVFIKVTNIKKLFFEARSMQTIEFWTIEKWQRHDAYQAKLGD